MKKGITQLTQPLGITSGGTGSATQNFVDTTTDQAIGGTKTFSVAAQSLLFGGNPYVDSATTNIVGSNLTIRGGQGKGTAIPTDINFQTWSTAPAGSPQSSLNTRITLRGSNGFLGVGTTTPGARLQVTGGLAVTTSNAQAADPGNGNASITGTLTTSGTVKLNGASTNLLSFEPATGFGAPTIDATRSAGTKIVLWNGSTIPGVGSADYALGIDTSTQWYSVPSATSSHKFYAGNTELFRINGTGAVTTPTQPTGEDNTPRVITSNWYWNSRSYAAASTSQTVPSGSSYQFGSNTWTNNRSQGGGAVTDWVRVASDGWYKISYIINLAAGSDYTYLMLIFQQFNAAANAWNTIATPLQINNNTSQFTAPCYSGSFDVAITWGTQDKILTWAMQQNNAASASRAVILSFSVEKMTF